MTVEQVIDRILDIKDGLADAPAARVALSALARDLAGGVELSEPQRLRLAAERARADSLYDRLAESRRALDDALRANPVAAFLSQLAADGHTLTIEAK